MGKLKTTKYHDSDKIARYWFWCPGCKEVHAFSDGWTFNGDHDKPTFSPSIVTDKDNPKKKCHSFVRNGQIQFLNDCYHEFKGQTVDMLDQSEWDIWHGLKKDLPKCFRTKESLSPQVRAENDCDTCKYDPDCHYVVEEDVIEKKE